MTHTIPSACSCSLPEHAHSEVVIIGGAFRFDIAYHLTAAGCLVIERESAQAGLDRQSMGGVRGAVLDLGQHSDVALLHSLYSDLMSSWGIPADTARKVTFCATSASHGDLRQNHLTQVGLGLKDARLLSGDDIRSMPQLRADDIVGGSFCSSDGFVDPYSVMNGFMSRACAITALKYGELRRNWNRMRFKRHEWSKQQGRGRHAHRGKLRRRMGGECRENG